MPNEWLTLLDFYDDGFITALANRLRLGHAKASRASHTAALAVALGQPARIRAEWEALSPGHRALLNAIVQAGGAAPVGDLRAQLKQKGLVDAQGQPPRTLNPQAKTSRRFEDLLAGLMLRGLVFPAARPGALPESAPAFWAGVGQAALPSRVIVPDGIRRHLPAPPPPRAPIRVSAVEAAAVVEGSARTFQRDLYLYWSYVRDHGARLTQKDEVQKGDLKKLNATLLVREILGKGEGELQHLRLRFLRHLLLGLALVNVDEAASLQAAPRAPEFFALPPGTRVQRTFDAWRQSGYFNELLCVPILASAPRLDPPLLSAPPQIAQARQAVVQALSALCAQLPAGAWLSLDTLCAWLRQANYDFLLPRLPRHHGLNHLVPAPPYSALTNPLDLDFPTIRSEAEGWNLVEANFIRGIVAGPLYWMGLADLGHTPHAKAGVPGDAFRLTPMGRWLLGLGPSPEIPEAGGRVIVQPNMHVVALDPVNDAVLVALDAFAERQSAERAVEYRLTRASVYAGQQKGWSADRIRAFLRDHTGADLPGNVDRTLDEWQAQHERIVLHPAVTLAHGPAEAFDALAKDPATARLLSARPLPEVALLPGQAAIPGLVSALRERGLLPVVSAAPNGLADSTAPPNSVVADESGALRFATTRPSLYLHGHLAAFADLTQADGADFYQMSPESVARAARAGLKAQDMVARLERVHRGPAPAGLLRRIRAWAKHFGDAALEPFTLLQVRDRATLAELRADPELAPLLHDFAPAPGKALAHVHPADLDRLRALLAERGVEVKDELE